MVRRFTRRLQQSGILIRAKKKRFYNPSPKKRALRKKALRREELKKEYEKLRKLGKL